MIKTRAKCAYLDAVITEDIVNQVFDAMSEDRENGCKVFSYRKVEEMHKCCAYLLSEYDSK